MNRKPELRTRRDLAVTDLDARGNPRHLIVIEDDSVPAPIVHTEAAQLPVRPAATSRIAAQVSGSYQDRAKGFSHTTTNLAVVTGIFAVIAGFALRDTMTFGVVTITFFLGFCATWLIAYVLHTFFSPEGSEIFEIWQYWRFIRAEQQHRHKRMKGE